MVKETIILDQLTVGYRRNSRQRVVQQGLSARFRSGELNCLVGSNGVGKSTLLKTISGFLPPLSGRVLTGGLDFHSLSNKEKAKMMSVVLTTRVEVDNISVEEMTAIGRTPYTGFFGALSDVDKEAVKNAIREVGIEHLQGRMFHELSDGERQKVMIAKSLAQNTPIILLDEPTSFLDFPSKVETFRLLQRLAYDAGKTILVSTHDLDLAVRLADRLWQLSASGLREVKAEEVAGDMERLVSSMASC